MSTSLWDRTRVRTAVSGRFDVLLGRIAPSTTARSTAEGRAKTIAARLASAMTMSRWLLSGSFYKETAVTRHSDLDLFVVFARDNVRWGGKYVTSTTVLGNIGTALRQSYPNTGVRRDEVAITVAFEQGAAPVDVVPAIYHRHDVTLGSPIYLIPDGNGGWMEAAPDADRKRFAAASLASGGKLSRVVRLVKWWARERATPIPLSMYHLEALVISEQLAPAVGRYADVLAGVFERLDARKGAALRDTVGLPGLIPVAGTTAKLAAVRRAVQHAATHARYAVDAEARGDLAEAVRQWQIVLPSFPTRLG